MAQVPPVTRSLISRVIAMLVALAALAVLLDVVSVKDVARLLALLIGALAFAVGFG